MIKLSKILSGNSYKELKNFHPSGKDTIPSGHSVQKGGFLKECIDNKNAFETGNNQYLINKNFMLIEAIHPTQYGLSDYRGGIVTFSTDVNSSDLSSNKVKNWFSKKLKTYKNRWFKKSKIDKVVKTNNDDGNEYIGALSIGKFFNGRYVGDNGKMFNEKSLSIEFGGLSSKALMSVSEMLADEFNQETVLLKDLNKNKVFLVNSDKNGNYDTSVVNKKV